jgi:xylulokinase
VAAGGDGNVFALGTGALDPGEMTLALGTSVVLGVQWPEPVIAPLFRTLIAPQGGCLLECVLQSGTYLLRWFIRRFGGDEAAWDRRAARIAAGAEGLVTLPHWWGVRFPEPVPEMRGATVGWADHHTPAHFYRSLLEGASLEVRRFDLELRKRLGHVGGAVRAGGGGTASRLWTRVLADVLGQPLAIGRETEPTALGAAILAAVGVGLFPGVAAACRAMTRAPRTIRPDPRRAALYARLYETAYAPLLDALAPVFGALRGQTTTRTSGSPRPPA